MDFFSLLKGRAGERTIGQPHQGINKMNLRARSSDGITVTPIEQSKHCLVRLEKITSTLYQSMYLKAHFVYV